MCDYSTLQISSRSDAVLNALSRSHAVLGSVYCRFCCGLHSKVKLGNDEKYISFAFLDITVEDSQ